MNKYQQAVASAEKKLARPPTTFEVMVELASKNGFETASVLNQILREDMLLASADLSQWTCEKKQGFFTFSQLFDTHYGEDYVLDYWQAIQPAPAKEGQSDDVSAQKVIRFSDIYNLLRSRQEGYMNEREWMFNSDSSRFLSGDRLRSKLAVTSLFGAGASHLC